MKLTDDEQDSIARAVRAAQLDHRRARLRHRVLWTLGLVGTAGVLLTLGVLLAVYYLRSHGVGGEPW